uniref:RING-type E3 ubiquitin transferase n=1 Tax=Branchiostoma floridae TaxID=7739 RepID=C3YHY9_BRAFL|eukprot:XP_002604115.1 hypothetical protein BRAFLDRAFT_71597 [Branchiostoma floridae]
MGSAPSSLKREVHEELSCSICLELFTRPKVLPCQHTFCQGCLQDHAEVRVPFQCPNCRQQVSLPPQGVTEDVKLYCKQCNVPVCTECCEEGHDGHPTTGLKKAAQERSSTVQALINEGRNIMENYLSYIRSLGGKEKTLNEKKQQTDNSIIQAYSQMVQKLTERKDQLLSESGESHKKILVRIQTERDKVLADVNELSAACDRAEQELQQGWVEILSQQTALTEVVGKYRGKAAPTPVQTQPAVFEPTDTPVPVLGHVTVRSLRSAQIQAAPATIPEAPTLVPAAPVSSNDAARGTGHHHGNQTHQPQKVTFGGFGSRGQFGSCGKFWNPSGVTVSDEGEIFVADWRNQRIQVFTLQGTFVREFPTAESREEEMCPQDVAMDGEGNLWVVGGIEPHAVQYNKQGRVLRKIGLQNIRWWTGVAVDTRRNHILITKPDDILESHGEVLVYRPDGTLVRTMGQQQGMKGPQYITVDGEGNVLVSDWRSKYVYVYNEDGQFLFQFGGYGSGEGQLKDPRGICTDRAGNIIVADQDNSCVEMFDQDRKIPQTHHYRHGEANGCCHGTTGTAGCN